MRGDRGRSGLVGRLARNRRGNVAVIFAVALLPIAMAAGAAVDLRRQATTNAYLQDAADASALAAAKAYYGAVGRTKAQRLQDAEATADVWMRQAVEQRAAVILNPVWRLKFDEDTGAFTFMAAGRSPAAFGGLFGIETLRLGVEGVATSGERRLEVALVLDSTGSMRGSKMANLKIAATRFVDVMAAAAETHPEQEAVRLSLVPYNNTVKVGAEYDDAWWMDKAGVSPIHYENFGVVTAAKAGDVIPTRFQMFKRLRTPWAGCVETRPQPNDVSISAPDLQKPETLFVPYFAPDEPDLDLEPTDREWDGGLKTWVRAGNYLPDGAYPADAASDWFKRQKNVSKYPEVAGTTPNWFRGGPNRDCVVAPIIRLTSTAAAIKTGIDAMKADGNTNIFMGLTWGWNALAPQAPFHDGQPLNTKDLTKIIILMTDGENVYSERNNRNKSNYAGLGYIVNNRLGITSGNDSKRQKAMDARMALLCENIKGTGTVIYTVRVELTGGSSKLLRQCASTENHFRDVQNASQLDAVFQDIARSILSLRIAG